MFNHYNLSFFITDFRKKMSYKIAKNKYAKHKCKYECLNYKTNSSYRTNKQIEFNFR